MKNTKIEWTHHTFNPWRGCSAVSEGCRNCYAEALSKRFEGAHGTWGVDGRRVIASDKYWSEPLKWNSDAERRGVRKRVFCASMADVFEVLSGMATDDRKVHPDAKAVSEARTRLRALQEKTPSLDWLMLTKRPENVATLCGTSPWPRNAWLGVSVENQDVADERVPILMDLKRRYAIPVAFLSVEPMLGEVDVFRYIQKPDGPDWIICGGESGPHARPMDADWARSLRDQCRHAPIPFFMKQMAQKKPIPEDLMIREFPR